MTAPGPSPGAVVFMHLVNAGALASYGLAHALPAVAHGVHNAIPGVGVAFLPCPLGLRLDHAPIEAAVGLVIAQGEAILISGLVVGVLEAAAGVLGLKVPAEGGRV